MIGNGPAIGSSSSGSPGRRAAGRRARPRGAARAGPPGGPGRRGDRLRQLPLLRRGGQAASTSSSTPSRCGATSTSARSARACSTSPDGSSGCSYERVHEAPVWHADVATYDVSLDGGRRSGRIHLDLHPREGKYNHAAQFDLVPGVRDVQLPEGVLVCNFPRGLMSHQDVVTLFHEFGHLMHHVLAGRHAWVRFAGVATEWDFVEAPSADARGVGVGRRGAARASRPTRRASPIPADLVARMRAADEFGKGYLAGAQMFYAAVSYRLHLERPADLAARRARALGGVQPDRAAARGPLLHRVRAPRRLLLGVLHLHVEPGHREGPLRRLRPRRPVRSRGVPPLPRPGPGARRQQGRRRPGRGLPGPALRRRGLHGLAETRSAGRLRASRTSPWPPTRTTAPAYAAWTTPGSTSVGRTRRPGCWSSRAPGCGRPTARSDWRPTADVPDGTRVLLGERDGRT